MKRMLYSIKDDVAGTFDFFGVFNSDALAVRSFTLATNVDSVPAVDLSLYRFASFDSESGIIIDTDFEFLKRGEKSEV